LVYLREDFRRLIFKKYYEFLIWFLLHVLLYLRPHLFFMPFSFNAPCQFTRLLSLRPPIFGFVIESVIFFVLAQISGTVMALNESLAVWKPATHVSI
jgi:hypothetical protein